MALLKVRRARFWFGQGSNAKRLQSGDVIDKRDFPEITKSKWEQLTHGQAPYFEEVDPEGVQPFDAAAARGQAELARARGAVSESPAPPPGVSLGCAECGFVANTSHGLLVHRGRKHGRASTRPVE